MSGPVDPARATVRRALFGGREAVHVWDLGARTAPFTAVLYCELEPGGSVGRHQQSDDDEVVIVVEGEGALSVDGARLVAERGTAVAVKLGAVLEIENTGTSAPLRYVIVKARRGV